MQFVGDTESDCTKYERLGQVLKKKGLSPLLLHVILA